MARPRLKMEAGQQRPHHSKAVTHSRRRVQWESGVSTQPKLMRKGAARAALKSRSKERLADAELYHNQFRGVSNEMREAYMSFLTPGTMFHTVVPVSITGAAIRGTHDQFPTISECPFDKGDLANAGTPCIYVGIVEVIRKTKVDDIMHEMKASVHTFILGGKQVIPDSILLVEPAAATEVE